MERLAPRQREIVVLRCRESLTIKEVAAQMGISTHTVKAQLRVIFHKCDAVTIQTVCYQMGSKDGYRLGVDDAIGAMRTDDI